MKTVLFLCSGNTCRSPMAECLFNQLCKERGLPLTAISAGMSARDGSPASDGSYHAMKERGLSLRHHRATMLTLRQLQDVSLIVAMTPSHVQLCRERFPELAIPIRSFSPPIPDPYGGSLTLYRQTADAIASQITLLAEEFSPAEGGTL